MNKKYLIIMLSTLFSFVAVTVVHCLDGKDIIALKKAGISDETIHSMIKEKTKETCAFSVQEIIDLKKAGLSDKTIQLLINDASFMRDTEPIVYGNDIRPIKFTTANDIIKLKKAGVSDETIRAIVIFASGDVNDVEREKAWEMLNNMGIMIDMRK